MAKILIIFLKFFVLGLSPGRTKVVFTLALHAGQPIINTRLSEDDPTTRLVTAARAGVKTGLAVYLAELEPQNLFKYNWSILWAGHTMVSCPLLELSTLKPQPKRSL